MPFMLINGTLYEAQHQGANEAERTYVGEAARAFSGAYRSGVRAAKRNWQFSLIPMTETVYDAFVAAIGLDVPIPVSGDFTGGVSVTSVVRIVSANYLPSGSTFVRVANISIQEA